MKIAVFDIDGVLADVAHRRHHISGGRRNWPAFFAAAGDDPPLAAGLARVHQAHRDGLLVMYLSGRPEHLRETTLQWLREHGLPKGELVLRADGDHSPAVRLKVSRLREIASAFSIGLLVDDDEHVISAVREHQPPIVEEVVVADWQDGGSRRTLQRAQERDGRT